MRTNKTPVKVRGCALIARTCAAHFSGSCPSLKVRPCGLRKKWITRKGLYILVLQDLSHPMYLNFQRWFARLEASQKHSIPNSHPTNKEGLTHFTYAEKTQKRQTKYLLFYYLARTGALRRKTGVVQEASGGKRNSECMSHGVATSDPLRSNVSWIVGLTGANKAEMVESVYCTYVT